MKGPLVIFAAGLAALLWMSFVGPWIARLCGVPFGGSFERGRQDQRLTGFQLVWASGLLVYGTGIFIFIVGPNIFRWGQENPSSANWAKLGWPLTFSILLGIMIGCIKALSATFARALK